jgi:PIN like domain
MKDLFSWRLPLSDSDSIEFWKKAIFVFDTNALLDLYRFSRSTSEDFLRLLEHLEGRIWLPYQVVDEFLNNREKVIASEKTYFEKALSGLEKWKNEQSNFKELRGFIANSKKIVTTEVEALFSNQAAYISAISEVEKCFKEKIEEVTQQHSNLNSQKDYILEKIFLLFDKKVGASYDQKDLQNLYEEGEKRYKQKKPPGFEDAKKKEGMQKYSDFILWKQILDFAKAKSCPIILVTGEKKDDWWTKTKDGKIVAPHLELRREFHEQVQQLFWMYQTQRFYEIAKDKLGVELNPRSIEEANAVAEEKAAEETAYEESLQAIQQLQNSAINLSKLQDLTQSSQGFSANLWRGLISENVIDENTLKALVQKSETIMNAIEEKISKYGISTDVTEEICSKNVINENTLKALAQKSETIMNAIEEKISKYGIKYR